MCECMFLKEKIYYIYFIDIPNETQLSLQTSDINIPENKEVTFDLFIYLNCKIYILFLKCTLH